jgi:serine/threonine protein kinase
MHLYEIGDFITVEEIGSGGFGLVAKAKNLRTGTLVAVKTLLVGEDGISPIVIREIAILINLKHPNIVNLEGIVIEHHQISLIFEIQPMDLKRYIATMPAGQWMNPTLVKSYCKQVI